MFRRKRKTLESELSKVFNLDSHLGVYFLKRCSELNFDPNLIAVEKEVGVGIHKFDVISDGNNAIRYYWKLMYTDSDGRQIDLYPIEEGVFCNFMENRHLEVVRQKGIGLYV